MKASRTRILLSAADIGRRVEEIARQIEADYGNEDEPLYLVAVLKGSFIFMADLVRAFEKLRVRIEFLAISSYGAAKESSGQVKLTRDLDVSIEGRRVLIVEDIVDSGLTLNYLLKLLGARKPKSLAIATLLDKPERRVQSVDIRYTGFQIPDEFVVGYGLDYAEDYRNLPDLCILEEQT